MEGGLPDEIFMGDSFVGVLTFSARAEEKLRS
jgi:hypothetical protein